MFILTVDAYSLNRQYVGIQVRIQRVVYIISGDHLANIFPWIQEREQFVWLEKATTVPTLAPVEMFL